MVNFKRICVFSILFCILIFGAFGQDSSAVRDLEILTKAMANLTKSLYDMMACVDTSNKIVNNLNDFIQNAETTYNIYNVIYTTLTKNGIVLPEQFMLNNSRMIKAIQTLKENSRGQNKIYFNNEVLLILKTAVSSPDIIKEQLTSFGSRVLQ